MSINARAIPASRTPPKYPNRLRSHAVWGSRSAPASAFIRDLGDRWAADRPAGCMPRSALKKQLAALVETIEFDPQLNLRACGGDSRAVEDRSGKQNDGLRGWHR